MYEAVASPPIVSADRRPTRGTRDRVWDKIRWLLVAAWLVLLVALPFVSERVAQWSDIQRLVSRGDVSSVTISGELPAEAGLTGMSHVQVRWSHDGLNYAAEVIQVREPGDAHLVAQARSHGYNARTVRPSADLIALDPALRISHDNRMSTLEGNRLLGFHVPIALAFAAFGLWLVGLGMLISGPDPWRATRWAWFWVLSSPVGVAAFLLLSGPTRPIPAPKAGGRRLTGGWAFLLNVFLGSALGASIHFL